MKMTTAISKAHKKSALTRPVFLIVLVIALLLAPSSVFAGGEDSPEPDSSPAADQTGSADQSGDFEAPITVQSFDSSVDQSGGFESPAPAETFESSGGFEQDTTADFSEGTAGVDLGATDPEIGSGGIENTEGSDTSASEQELAPPETASGTSNDSDSPSDTEPPAAEIQTSETGIPAITTPTDGDEFPATETQNLETESPSGTFQNSEAENTTTFFQVAEVSMSPLLNPGAIIEIVSETYADGDMVVAQTSDGKFVVKMLDGDQLIPLGAGISYPVADVTILGSAGLSSVTAEVLEQSGLSFSKVLAETSTLPASGNGTSGDPYQIATWDNLYWLSQQSGEWGKNYLQTADITFPAEINTWDSNQGWTPIGNATTSFNGTYDGQGFAISGLYINRPTANYIGLFGYTGSSAILQSIILEDVNITGKQEIGGLIGVNSGTIKNCYVTGSVEGINHVGGLVGSNIAGLIENSCSSSDVTGTETRIGGLVGWNLTGTIENSYSTGNVSGTNNVGGLVGHNWGLSSEITNSYATGSVSGTGNVGGLIGENREGTIENSYATGSVSGNGTELNVGVGGLIGKNEGMVTKSNATGSIKGVNNVGGLIGWHQVGTIENSYASGTVSGDTKVGGLVGWNGNNVGKSYASGTVNGVNNVGGLVGQNDYIVVNSYATGAVTGTGSGSNVGGLVGNNQKFIIDSYATGDVIGTDNIGGLVGSHYLSAILNSYSAGHITGSGSNVGGLIGYVGSGTITKCYWDTDSYNGSGIGNLVAGTADVTGKTTPEMKDRDTFINWDFNNTWIMSSAISFGGYPTLRWTGGYAAIPTEDNGTCQIATLPNLVWVAENSDRWAGNYTQTADINMWTTPSWDGSKGWTTIGNETTKFTGTYNGQGFVISDLLINRPGEDKIGLFGITGTSEKTAMLKNIILVDLNITGDNQVGGLAGINQHCTIENSYASGTVTGKQQVGGLVGGNEGTITNSHANVVVTGSSNCVGGLVGISNNTIVNSYASGTVTGNDYVGGLVGYNISVIKNCHAIGPVTVSVTVTPKVGGLVGDNDNGTVDNCYYDSETTGQSDVGKGVPKTTAEMKDITTFSNSGWSIASTTGYDPDDIKTWYIKQIEKAKDYPRLYWQYETILKVVANDQSITYRQSDPGFTAKFYDLIDNEVAPVGTLEFEQGPVVNPGFYNDGIIPEMQSYDGNNHLFMLVSGDLTITKAPLTITANSDSKVYDTIAYYGGNGVTYTGFVGGETESVLGGTLSYCGNSQGAVNVGIYVITPEGLTSDNYEITFVDGKLEITKAPITIDTNDYGLSFDNLQFTQQSTGLTTITGQGSAVISPGIIAYGGWNDLYQASAAYQVALARLENDSDPLSPPELALLEVELAIAKAALLAMEARLLAADGLPYNLAALQAAYAAAVTILSAQQGFLSADQQAAANQLLAAIAGVITALQYGVT
jgi:hypothetical protein